ncbi:hypothetical protein JHK85_052439 [Glycine max]|nr:hypothetical protein JHK85_052439 [Glycine max]
MGMVRCTNWDPFIWISICAYNLKEIVQAIHLCLLMCHAQLFCKRPVINKTRRSMPVLDNREEGEKYAEHGLRKFLRTRPPEIMPTINHFFSEDK